MMYVRIFSRVGLMLILAVAMVACTENASGPNTSEVLNSGDLALLLAVQDDVQQLDDGGIVPLDSAYGVFSIGWNQFITPDQQEETTGSHAFAVAYDELSAIGIRRKAGGVDLGDVSISYAGNSIALSEKATRMGGFIYSLFNHPRNTTAQEIEFVGGETYQMIISGSDNFTPLTVALTAPSSAISVDSPANGDTVDAAQDLVINWSGGTTDDPVLLKIVAHDRPGGPKGRHGHKPGDRPMPHEMPGAVFVTLDNNPGTYTVTAAELQDLLGDAASQHLAVHVSQVVKSTITHDGNPYIAALRTGDRVILTIQ